MNAISCFKTTMESKILIYLTTQKNLMVPISLAASMIKLVSYHHSRIISQTSILKYSGSVE